MENSGAEHELSGMWILMREGRKVGQKRKEESGAEEARAEDIRWEWKGIQSNGMCSPSKLN